MKLEKILETLTAYVNTLPEAEAEAIRTIAATRRKVSPRHAVGPAALGNLLVDLREGVISAAAKAAGRSSVLSACKRILKGAARIGKPAFDGAWIGKDGRQYLTTGFLGVVLAAPVDLPVPESDDSDARAGMEPILSATPDSTAPLTLPDLATVKAHVKICKATGTEILWDFGPGLGLYNAQYLADLMEALPGCTATIQTGVKHPIMYLQAPDGSQGILLPVRPLDRAREVTADRYAPAPDPQPDAETPPETTPETTPEAVSAPAVQASEATATEAEARQVRAYIESIAAEYPHHPGDHLVRIRLSEYPTTCDRCCPIGDGAGGLVHPIRDCGQVLQAHAPDSDSTSPEETAPEAQSELAIANSMEDYTPAPPPGVLLWVPRLTEAASLCCRPPPQGGQAIPQKYSHFFWRNLLTTRQKGCILKAQ